MKIFLVAALFLIGAAGTFAQQNAKDESPPANLKVVAAALIQLEARVKKGEDVDTVVREVLAPLSPDDRAAFQKGLSAALKEALANRNQESFADSPEDENGSREHHPKLGNTLLSGVDRYWESEKPDDPAVFSASGEDHYRIGNFQQSYRDYDKAIALGASDPRTYLGYGRAAYRLGDFDLVKKLSETVLAKDPKNQEALFLYHAAKDRPPVIKLPTSLGELAEDRSAQGVMPLGAGAVPVPVTAVSFSGLPPSGMTAEQAAVLARQAAAPGVDAQARSLKFSKDAAEAMRLRDYTTAVERASQAIVLNPQNAQALNYRAMSLSQLRRYSDAVQDANTALSLAPGNAAVLHTRSWAFSNEGKYQEALRDAEAASAQEPSNAFLLQDKAFALAGLGDRLGALDALRRSAALDPNFAARFEQAQRLPRDQDMTLLFGQGLALVAAPPPSHRPTSERFLRLLAFSAVGGVLIALGILNVVSASWRDRTRMTLRRVLGRSTTVSVPTFGAQGSFWTRYELIKEIGLGGMGRVYEAVDLSLKRRVAVKKMRDEIRLDPRDRRRFVNEARLVAQLHHPGIVDIYNIVEEANDVYLVFEFVEGRTLADVLASDGAMNFARARRILKEIADAVDHAHARGVIHRDLKPSNVMLTPEDQVKVMDFGVAREAQDVLARRSRTNTVVGTPPYMAPEQEQGTVRRESDVYALGVCLYEMVTGSLPFSGSSAAMLLDKLNGKLQLASRRNPALPAGFDSVIARSLDPDPDQRYRTPAEFVAALDALAP